MTTHGKRSTPEYSCWTQMRQRCRNSRVPTYQHYGGRGISIDPAWDDFTVFLRDMGPRPSPQHSIDRIDNSGNYGPGNCRWATRSEQAFNRRARKTYAIEDCDFSFNGLAIQLGIDQKKLWWRMFGTKTLRPWPMARILYQGTVWAFK